MQLTASAPGSRTPLHRTTPSLPVPHPTAQWRTASLAQPPVHIQNRHNKAAAARPHSRGRGTRVQPRGEGGFRGAGAGAGAAAAAGRHRNYAASAGSFRICCATAATVSSCTPQLLYASMIMLSSCTPSHNLPQACLLCFFLAHALDHAHFVWLIILALTRA